MSDWLDRPPLDPEAIEAAYRRRSFRDPVLFAKGLTIPSEDKGPKLFKDVIASFQEECLRLLAPSLSAIRGGWMPKARRFWIERTKKAAKDSDLAICVLWLTAFSTRPTLVQVSAANQQQAGIVKRRASDLLFYNGWLNDLVAIRQNRIIGKNGMCEVVIEATGASGAKQGDTPDLLILNELVHVEKWAVNETHMNNADGVPKGVVIVSTNAGIKGSRAEVWRKNATSNPDRWTVRIYSQLAPWIRKDDVEEARRRDPVGSEFGRLWMGRWQSGKGGAVDDAAIERCFTLEGPLKAPEPGWTYAAGLDLGVSHDHSGVVVVGANHEERKAKLAWARGWVPVLPNDQGQLEVDAEDVEGECLRLWNLFRIQWFGYDPAAGGSFMAQSLRRRGVPMREMSFGSPANLTAMATAFVTMVRGGRLECFEDPEGRLRRDFGKFSIVVKVPSGYRLEAVSDEFGHADVGTALVICLPTVQGMMAWGLGLQEDDVLAEEPGGKREDREKMRKELEGMPAGLREIYESVEGGEDVVRGSGGRRADPFPAEGRDEDDALERYG